MKRKRLLPEHVTGFRDRHGKVRLRFRRKGFESHYMRAALGTEEFRTEYKACMEGKIDTVAAAIDRALPGTVDDLVTRYFAVPTRLGPTEATQSKVRAIIARFRNDHGHRFVADFRFDHIEKIVQGRVAKVLVGKRMEGGTYAARKLRKELVRLFDFAVKLRMRSDNPASLSDRIKTAPGERSKGFHTWTEAEIAQYRDRHSLGTKARLAMELMLWTGQRRIDAIRLGRQHTRNGRINVVQSKTGKELWLPIAPQLLEAIVSMPPQPTGGMCFLLNDWGRPFTNPSFGNKMRDWCDAADLPQCTAHGLRKAMMRRLAELQMSNQSLKSVSGHSRDDEVATYTRDVDQARMADVAIAMLSKWETGEGEAVKLLPGS